MAANHLLQQTNSAFLWDSDGLSNLLHVLLFHTLDETVQEAADADI